MVWRGKFGFSASGALAVAAVAAVQSIQMAEAAARWRGGYPSVTRVPCQMRRALNTYGETSGAKSAKSVINFDEDEDGTDEGHFATRAGGVRARLASREEVAVEELEKGVKVEDVPNIDQHASIKAIHNFRGKRSSDGSATRKSSKKIKSSSFGDSKQGSIVGKSKRGSKSKGGDYDAPSSKPTPTPSPYPSPAPSLYPSLPEERVLEILREFYVKTQDNSRTDWTFSSGWDGSTGKSPCYWFGMSCRNKDGVVDDIDLSSNNLDGRLEHTLLITELVSLRYLNLEENNLVVGIPEGIGNLQQLQVLNLQNNGWGTSSQTLPWSLTSLINLNDLYLGDIGFTGTIPEEIGELHKLRVLHLEGNELTGTIPQSIGYLHELVSLNLGKNLLVKIPASLGCLHNLVELRLNHNPLFSTMPSEMGMLHHLEILNLRKSHVFDMKPVYNLTQLVELDLHDNSLAVGGPTTILPSISRLSNLKYLDISESSVNGTIPSEIGMLSNIEFLDLHAQFEASLQLTGTLPSELGMLSNLKQMILYWNALQGPLPAELGMLIKLEQLYLNENDFTGPLPAELGDLPLLKAMDLSYNMLTGTIPQQEYGKLEMLEELGLGFNDLEGSVKKNSSLCQLRANENSGGMLVDFWTDCPDEVDCECCTSCSGLT